MTPRDRAWESLARLHQWADWAFQNGTAKWQNIDDDAARLRAYLSNEPFIGRNDPPQTEDK